MPRNKKRPRKRPHCRLRDDVDKFLGAEQRTTVENRAYWKHLSEAFILVELQKLMMTMTLQSFSSNPMFAPCKFSIKSSDKNLLMQEYYQNRNFNFLKKLHYLNFREPSAQKKKKTS